MQIDSICVGTDRLVLRVSWQINSLDSLRSRKDLKTCVSQDSLEYEVEQLLKNDNVNNDNVTPYRTW